MRIASVIAVIGLLQSIPPDIHWPHMNPLAEASEQQESDPAKSIVAILLAVGGLGAIGGYCRGAHLPVSLGSYGGEPRTPESAVAGIVYGIGFLATIYTLYYVWYIPSLF